ncbi:hypothetical protein CPL00376_CDS0064 [Klebsiella phage SlimeyKevin]
MGWFAPGLIDLFTMNLALGMVQKDLCDWGISLACVD